MYKLNQKLYLGHFRDRLEGIQCMTFNGNKVNLPRIHHDKTQR